MSVYHGYPVRIGRGGFKVTKDDKILRPTRSQRVINHSPDGFNWGYHGSGPAQLALALLLEEIGGRDASTLYQKFKWDVIARLPIVEEWVLTSGDIADWLKGKL